MCWANSPLVPPGMVLRGITVSLRPGSPCSIRCASLCSCAFPPLRGLTAMNRTIPLIFLMITMSLTVLASSADPGPATQPATPPQEAAMKAVLTRQQTAWNQGDLETFMHGYWDYAKLTFPAPSGITTASSPFLTLYTH